MLSARSAEGVAGSGYERHRLEQTLFYQIIEQHYPDFLSVMGAQDRSLPGYVQDEFEIFLQCGRLKQGLIPGVLPSTPAGRFRLTANTGSISRLPNAARP